MKVVKVLGTLLTGALFATNVVSAAPSGTAPVKPMLISTTIPQDSYGGLKYVLVVNGKGFSPNDYPLYLGTTNEVMVPIRAAVETLGYTLTWKQDTQSIELMKDNQHLSLQIGQDKYKADQTETSLGIAPQITDEKTYVPISFFEKVLRLKVQADETGTITIKSADKAVSAITKQGTITSLTYSNKGGEIGLNGYSNGVRLSISEETEIVTADNKKLTLADLKLGMSIEAEHSLVMALSMPPLTSAKKIVVKDSASTLPTLGTAGLIEEVTPSQDGTTRLVVKGNKLSDNSFDMIVLNLSATTPILGTKDNQALAVDQLKKGDKVFAFYGPMLTKSLPPIGQAAKIVVEN